MGTHKTVHLPLAVSLSLTHTTNTTTTTNNNTQVPRYDPFRLVSKLQSKCRLPNGTFDWRTFGQESGACYNAVPSRVKFLAGPLEADFQPVQRERARRRQTGDQDEEDEEGKKEDNSPEEVKEQEQNNNQLSAVERNYEKLAIVLRKATKRQKKRDLEEIAQLEQEEQETKRKRLGEVDMIPFLMNPESFTQTIENLFHASFLVKQGHVKLAVRENGPTMKLLSQQETAPRAKQAIMTLNMKDWRKMVQAYQVDKSIVPHRRIEK